MRFKTKGIVTLFLLAVFLSVNVFPAVAGNRQPAIIIVNASCTSLYTDENADVVALVTDIQGNVLPDVSVTMSVNNGTLSKKSVVTNSDGLAQTTFKPNKPGYVEISARASSQVTPSGYIEGRCGINVLAATDTGEAPSDVYLAQPAGPSMVLPGSKRNFSVHVLNAAQQRIYLSASSGTVSPSSTVIPDNDYVFNFDYTAPDSEENAIITASIPGVTQSQTITKITSQNLPVMSAIRPGWLYTGEVFPGEVQFYRTSGAIPNAKVKWEADKGTWIPTENVTDSNGRASSLYVAPMTSGIDKWTISIPEYNKTVACNVSIQSKSSISVTAEPKNMTAGEESTISGSVVSIDGNPCRDADVKLTLSGQGTLSESTVKTDNKGVFETKYQAPTEVNKRTPATITAETEIFSAAGKSKTIKGSCIVFVEPDPHKIKELKVIPDTMSLQVDEKRNLKAEAIYSDGHKEDVTSKATWTSSDKSIATVSKGTVTGMNPGTITITATLNGLSDTASVKVNTGTKAKELKITPNSLQLQINKKDNLKAEVIYSNGTKENVTNKASWVSKNKAVVSVSKGSVTGHKAGDTTVTASWDGMSDTAEIKVVDEIPDIKSFRVTPSRLTLQTGAKDDLKAEVIYNNEFKEDVTKDAKWTTSNKVVATVNKGTVSGLKKGKAKVEATWKGLSDDTNIDVVDEAIQLEVLPKNLKLKVDQKDYLKAVAVYKNSRVDVTDKASWSVSNNNVSVSDGQVTGLKSGTATVKATWDGLSDTANIDVIVKTEKEEKVDNKTPVRIVTYPEDITITEGQEGYLHVVVVYDDGSTKDITDNVNWSSDHQTVIVSNGVVKGNETGSATVTATWKNFSNKVNVTVTDTGVPPTENLPDGTIVDRMPGYLTLAKPVKIDNTGDGFFLLYDSSLSDNNKDRYARAYYWNQMAGKWVALTTYPAGTGKLQVLNDGNYAGWFCVFGTIQPSFRDGSGHWATDVVDRMNGMGLVEGYPNPQHPEALSGRIVGTERNISRAEFVTILARILGLNPGERLYPVLEPLSPSEADYVLERYNDEVAPWAKPYIAAATKSGIVAGRGNKFDGNAPITRVEAAVAVSSALKKVPNQEFKNANLSAFKDGSAIPGWARSGIADGVIRGYPDGTFKPGRYITRSESLAVLLQLLRGLGW